MELKFQIQLKILKPVEVVFDAVVDPQKLTGYFTKTATPLKEGGIALWSFAEHPGEFPVHVQKIITNKLIVFEWETTEGGYNTRVEISFEAIGPDSTIVRISESGWKQDQKGLNSSYDNCMGWTHMACCLKAFAEYGINLRKGGAI